MTLWYAGLAAKLLDDWSVHARNFVPIWCQRLDFDDHVTKLEARMDDAGEDPVAAKNLIMRLRRAHATASLPFAEQAISWMGQALDWRLQPTSEVQDPFEPVSGELVQWPTGIEELDAITGGGYGLTVFAGSPKLGKSMAAMGAAIRAGCAGWSVMYVNAELTPREIRQRMMQYIAHGTRPDPLLVRMNVIPIHAHRGFQFADLLGRAEEAMHLETDRVLIVLDSINRLAKCDGTEGGDTHYYRRLDAWGEWARMLVRLGEGRISVLAVSELNRAMQIKGADLEYSANLVVRFTEGDALHRSVNIEAWLSRETRSGACGEYDVNWPAQRFERLDSGVGG